MDQLPPPPIQIFPSGLLGFFGIKNGGRNPQELAQLLSPTVELLPWYLATRRETISGVQIGVTGLNTYSFGGPPQNEAWYVHYAGIRATTAIAAGATWAGRMALAIPTAAGTTIVSVGDGPARVGQAGEFASVEPARDVWVFPNEAIVLAGEVSTGAPAFDVRLNMVITRLPA